MIEQEYKKSYYLKNREKLLAYQKEYNKINKRKNNNYYLKNRDKLLKRQNEYYKERRVLKPNYEIERKQAVQLYWLWKLKAKTITAIVEEHKLKPFFLMKEFLSLDEEFVMKDWKYKI